MKQTLGAKVALAFAAAIIGLGQGASAKADIFVETFDGPLNSAIWDVETGGNDWLVDNGKLSITRTNGNNSRMLFLPQLIGDFDVQFDYSLFWANTFAFGDRIQLGAFTDTPVHSYNVGHTQEGSIFALAVDPSPRFQFGSNTPTGKMRITRTAGTVSMQFQDSNSLWVTLQTGNDLRDMWVGLNNYVFNGFTAGSRVEIDNFRIVADNFSISIPEPSIGLFLVGGMGLLLGRRQKRIG